MVSRRCIVSPSQNPSGHRNVVLQSQFNLWLLGKKDNIKDVVRENPVSNSRDAGETDLATSQRTSPNGHSKLMDSSQFHDLGGM